MTNPQHVLQILRDPKGKKDAEKFYETYHPGQDKDYARYAEWLIALDKLMQTFGCRPLPPEPDVPEDEEDEQDNSPVQQDDQEYGPDDDLHAMASMRRLPSHVEQIKMAVGKILREKK